MPTAARRRSQSSSRAAEEIGERGGAHVRNDRVVGSEHPASDGGAVARWRGCV